MYFFYWERSHDRLLFSLYLFFAGLQAQCFSGVYTAAAKGEIFYISSAVAATEAKPSSPISLGEKQKGKNEERQL